MALKLYRLSRNVKSIKVCLEKIKCVGKSVIKTCRPGSFRQLCCIIRPREKKKSFHRLSVREKRLNISVAFSSLAPFLVWLVFFLLPHQRIHPHTHWRINCLHSSSQSYTKDAGVTQSYRILILERTLVQVYSLRKNKQKHLLDFIIQYFSYDFLFKKKKNCGFPLSNY